METLNKYLDTTKAASNTIAPIILNCFERKNLEYCLKHLGRIVSQLESSIKKPQLLGAELIIWMKNHLQLAPDSAIALCMIMAGEGILVSAKKTKKFEEAQFYSVNSVNSMLVKDVPKPNPSLLSYQPAELAQQMMFYEFELFGNIHISELAKNVWTKSNKNEMSPNVMKMIENSNHVIRWIASEIISTPNLKKRIAVMKHCISLASHCLRLNNFNAVFEVMAGMNTGPVRRLAQTWSGLPSSTLEILLGIEEIVNSDDNWKKYRSILENEREKHQTIIPYLGIILKDIIYADDVYNTFAYENVLNYKKNYALASVFAELIYYQEKKLQIKYLPSVQTFLRGQKEILSENDMYKRSKFIEPPKDATTRQKK